MIEHPYILMYYNKMVDKIINTKDYKRAQTVIISAPYERGVSFMGGTSRGPQKIVEALDNNLEIFNKDLLCEPANYINTAHIEIKEISKMSAQKAIGKISSVYQKVFEKGRFPILLGGEHTVSLGAIKAIAKKLNPKNITIVQIDAHQDLRDDNSDYSKQKNKYAHSCVMRRAHELGFNIVQVGIRTFSKYEYSYWQENKKSIKVFEWTGKEPKMESILKSIKTKKVYLSIDVDGFDPSHMPGTGTPVPGGILWKYGTQLIKKILREKELVGADIVEVSPQRDSVLTEYSSAEICYTLISEKFKDNIKDN